MEAKANDGFSLAELMVVVAIVGILVSVAIPNFMLFKAKAIQSSAKVELSAVYMFEKAFYLEWDTYSGMLDQIGYFPEGYDKLSCVPLAAGTYNGPCQSTPPSGTIKFYMITFDWNAPGCEEGDFTGACRMGMPCNGIGEACGVRGYRSNVPGAPFGFPADVVPVQPTFTVVMGVGGTFRAAAIGFPKGYQAGVTVTDLWTINNSRALINTQSGL